MHLHSIIGLNYKGATVGYALTQNKWTEFQRKEQVDDATT